MSDATFPRPAFTGEGAPFWLSARDGHLDVQACANCGRLRHPPGPVCAECGSVEQAWTTVSGQGEAWSFTIIHPPTLEAFADRVPYCSVVVRLAEGPFLVGTLIGIDADAVQVGMAVEVGFERIDHELTVPVFRPTDDGVR